MKPWDMGVGGWDMVVWMWLFGCGCLDVVFYFFSTISYILFPISCSHVFLFVLERAFHPMLVGDVEEGESAVDIGFDKDFGIFDGIVDVAFGSEMDDTLDVVGIENVFDQLSVANVAMYESVARVWGVGYGIWGMGCGGWDLVILI